MSAHPQLITVFSKGNIAQGNQAAVFFNQDDVDLSYDHTKMSADIFKEKGIETTCFISQQDLKHYKVQCFNKDNAIQYCGHGMIAAAKMIFAKSDVSEIIINNTTAALLRRHSASNDVIELAMPRLTATMQAVPGWMRNVLTLNAESVLPGYSAVSDKEDGYLLLEITPVLNVKDFSALKLDLTPVCNNTKRAVVVIQFDREKKHLYMRYFAPQYGVIEDTATGSVMRLVADYIEQRYNCNEYDARQCSVRGGYMQVVCMAESVNIIANASSETGI